MVQEHLLRVTEYTLTGFILYFEKMRYQLLFLDIMNKFLKITTITILISVIGPGQYLNQGHGKGKGQGGQGGQDGQGSQDGQDGQGGQDNKNIMFPESCGGVIGK